MPATRSGVKTSKEDDEVSNNETVAKPTSTVTATVTSTTTTMTTAAATTTVTTTVSSPVTPNAKRDLRSKAITINSSSTTVTPISSTISVTTPTTALKTGGARSITIDSSDTNSKKDTPASVVKRKVGRPPKNKNKLGETSTPTTATTSTPATFDKKKEMNDGDEETMEEDEISDKDVKLNNSAMVSPKGANKRKGPRSLRNRDQIKVTDRYSPEVYEPPKRGRKSQIQFPSTSATSSKYISFESDEETTATTTGNVNETSGNASPKRKRTESSPKKEVCSYIVDVKKDEESNKMVIMLPDGTTYKVDATPDVNKNKQAKRPRGGRPLDDDFEEYVEDDESGNDDDEDYKPIPKRKTDNKSITIKKDGQEIPSAKAQSKQAAQQNLLTTASGIRLSKQTKNIKLPSPSVNVTPSTIPSVNKIYSSTKNTLASSGNKVSKEEEGTTTTKITTPSSTAGKTKVTFITTPKSVTVTATQTTFKQPPKRNYGSGTKFIDELPDLNECTNEENDNKFTKLPDKVLLINSDLPLVQALNFEHDQEPFLFRQVISPIMTGFPCLLCSSSKLHFKEEKDLITHYSTSHELQSEIASAKFSEEIVFVCLPKAIIAQLNDNELQAGIILNAPCQYCGDEIKLSTIQDMRKHYLDEHLKGIELIEQEEILCMHKSLYCYQCNEKSDDFLTHHKHMKSKHQQQTLVCKRCLFTTQDATRLKTHFKAKHMISNKMQNLQCCYCNGLVTGVERMNKHIMSSHCVQTGINEYSCTYCLQPCGKSDELLAHSFRCPIITGSGCNERGKDNNALSGVKVEINENDQSKVNTNGNAGVGTIVTGGANSLTTSSGNTTESKLSSRTCFLCDKIFDTEEKCALHLNHVHTKWLSRSVLHETFLMVLRSNGKTEIMPKPSGDPATDASILKLSDLAPIKDLDEVGTKTNYGHYCFKCETVIKLYPLYYLHMYNVHKLGKMFECKISSCKQTFKDAKQLEEHVKQTKHPQKSVIEDPLTAIACHYCDAYFVSEKDLQDHHLTEEHFNKINLLIDRSGNKPEPRNHKCKTCHTWFGLMDSFVYHMETESHKHGCPYCGLHFALPSSRRTHIQSHHSEKIDICELCSAKQGSKERLFAHLVEHNIVFECNRCMRKFYQREQLNAHMETHGEPVDCPWDSCSKKINRSVLSSHIRQHRIESESKCQSCGKTFNSRQLLALHMDVHAKAETNAKAILSSVNPNSVNNTHAIVLKGTNTPTIQGLNSSGNTNKIENVKNNNAVTTNNINSSAKNLHSNIPNVQEIPPAGTTLISITTPPSNLTSIKPKTSPRAYTSKGIRQRPMKTVSPTRNSSTIPVGMKIMCCSCNQLFNSHNELSLHKCVVPVVTITGPNDASLTTVGHVNSVQPNSIEISNKALPVATGISSKDLMKDETTSDNLEEDPEKLVLDLAAQLTEAVQAEEAAKLKDRQLQKVEQMMNQQAQQRQHSPQHNQHSALQHQQQQPQQQLNRGRITYSSMKPNQMKQQETDLTKANQNPIQEIKTTLKEDVNVNSNINTQHQQQALLQQQQQEQTLTYETNTTMLANDDVDKGAAENVSGEDQCFVIQQPDGQLVQLTVPAGMDLEEVLRSLNIALATGNEEENIMQEQVSVQDTAQLSQPQQTTDENADVGEGEQQVIYLPLNEDGTCAIDEAALAMLTGSTDMPIIVTSNN